MHKLIQISLCICISFIIYSNAQLNGELDVPQNPNYRDLDVSQCDDILSRSTIKSIHKYKKVAKKIRKHITKGQFRGQFYRDLATFADKFGSRISGSPQLETAITYMKEEFGKIGLNDVKEQPVMVPKWVRSYEHAEMLEPYNKKMNILGLGTSVGTPEGGLTGEVIVVKGMDELRNVGEQGLVKGKIVLYNFDVTYYSEVTGIVNNAASNASSYGSIAALTKSITRVSINSPHTKLQNYVEGVPKIPVASVTLEDAGIIGRMVNRGEKVVVKLILDVKEVGGESPSRNLIVDIKGRKRPEEIVLTSGHIDSWDVGQGVQDDGVGVFLTFETMRLFQSLGLKPRRTVRGVIWTAEEMSPHPPEVYMEEYKAELTNHNVLMESDFGCYKPTGFYYSQLPDVGCILYEITKLFPQTNTTVFTPVKEIPNDLDEFIKVVNVPTVSLNGNDGRYFWYHHTDGDTMAAVDTDDLDSCLIVWATTVYVLADMKENMPRPQGNK